MQNVDEQIKRIEVKLQLLLKAYQQSQKEIYRLQEENRELVNQVSTYSKKSQELAQTIDVMNIRSLTQNDTTKKDLDKRINTYLKEIDKCLALLQS